MLVSQALLSLAHIGRDERCTCTRACSSYRSRCGEHDMV